MMTRKDYEAIAKAIRESEIDGLEKNSLAIRLGNELLTTNPRFDFKRFVNACMA